MFQMTHFNAGGKCGGHQSNEKWDHLRLKSLALVHFEQKSVFLSLVKGKASPSISHWAAVRSHCCANSAFVGSWICHTQDKAFFKLQTNVLFKKKSILHWSNELLIYLASCFLSHTHGETTHTLFSSLL